MRGCTEVLHEFDRPISPDPELAMVRRAQLACANTGPAIERLRVLARDHEQRRAVCMCSAAFTEYAALQGQRLDRRATDASTAPDKRDLFVEGLYDVCLEILRELGR